MLRVDGSICIIFNFSTYFCIYKDQAVLLGHFFFTCIFWTCYIYTICSVDSTIRCCWYNYFFLFFGMVFDSIDLRLIRCKAQCIIGTSGKNSNHAYQCKWITFSSNIYRDVISLNHNKLLNAIYIFLTDPKIRYSVDKRPSYCW